jgi:hypothetical protein
MEAAMPLDTDHYAEAGAGGVSDLLREAWPVMLPTARRQLLAMLSAALGLPGGAASGHLASLAAIRDRRCRTLGLRDVAPAGTGQPMTEMDAGDRPN